MAPGIAVRRAGAAYAIFAAVVAVVAAVVLALVGLGIFWSILVGVVAGLAAAAAVYMRADSLALSALGARPAAPGELPRLENLVESLVVANGFRMPQLYLVDDPVPNAAAIGRTPRHSALVVTTGLVERLRRIELEGVLAHELSRIRSRQSLSAVTAAQLAGRMLGFSERLSSAAARHLLDPSATVVSDMAGVSITRYPPGLAAALAAMRADGRHPERNHRAYRHLWINVPPDGLADHDFSVDDRIEVLHEL